MKGGKIGGRAFVADVPKNEASVIRVFRRMAGKRELLELQVFAVPAVDVPKGRKGNTEDGFLPVAGLELTADRETWERFARQVLKMDAKGVGKKRTGKGETGQLDTPPAPRGELTAS